MFVKTRGFADTERALAQIAKKVTRKNVGIRALTDGAEPMRATIAAHAPRKDGDLSGAVAIAARMGLSGRGGGKRTKRGGGGGSFGDRVEVFIGIDAAAPVIDGNHPMAYALVAEYGRERYTVRQAPHPFFRPGFDSEKHATIDRIRDALTVQIGAAVKRQSARSARG